MLHHRAPNSSFLSNGCGHGQDEETGTSMSGLAMNDVRRSENRCSCSVFCSAFGSERVRHLVRLLFVFGVRGLLCSCSCANCLFVFSLVFRSYPHVDVEC